MVDTDITIKVEKLSKRYRIGIKEEMHDSILPVVIDFIKSPLRNYRKYRSLYVFSNKDYNEDIDSTDGSTGVIWPLKNVSFQVKRGEVVGIIGRNGAGKSTLLKILSRITDPTNGRIEIRGRVSSLLEVGTGFHQELTGKENVYLNGTILGMRKKEIDRKLDEIIEFSGVKKFIDTPVKRYSSGMKVRLAFSVAAHMEPEILIVDEVLAVGDIDFQQKCLQKMEDISELGRTVLFVSHNMSAITRLCTRAILINDGSVINDGPAQKIVNSYLFPQHKMKGALDWSDLEAAPGDNIVRLKSIRVVTDDRKTVDSIDVRKPIKIEMEYKVLTADNVLTPYYYLLDENGEVIFGTIDQDMVWRNQKRQPGCYVSSVVIPGNFLSPGLITINAYIMTAKTKVQHMVLREAITFEVIDSFHGDSSRGDYTGSIAGKVRPLFEWNTALKQIK